MKIPSRLCPNSVLGLVLIQLITSCEAPPDHKNRSAYVIRNAGILSPERHQMLENGAVVVAAGLILWVGKDGDLPDAWVSARAIDATGKFLVPGFLDSHVHVGHIPFLSDRHHNSRPDLVDAYYEQLPKSYLFFGFTSLIDLDLRNSSRERFEKASIAPRLFGGGRGIRLFEGYGPALMEPEVRYQIFPVWTFNYAQTPTLPTGTNVEDHTAETLIANAAKGGAIAIKTYHEPGFGGVFDWPVPSPELLSRIVTTAHQHGLPVALHATGLDSYRAGIKAGVDIFAHGLWHWPGSRLEGTPPAEARAALQDLTEANTAVQPTARVILGEADTFAWSLLGHPHFPDVVPREIISWLATEEGHWAQRDLAALFDQVLPRSDHQPIDYINAMNQRVHQMLALYRQADVQLIFGSDTPATQGVGNPPGLNGHLEIIAWADAGFTPLETLQALTLDNARAFGLDDELGSIETGKYADLLLLEDDPRESVGAFDSISLVIAGGEVYTRDQLSARLQ